jgi:toxin ParE1/3/4
MYKLKITNLAQNDLESIVAYIAEQLGNPSAAGNFLDKVEESYKNLKSNPLIYPISNNEKLAGEGFRKAIINNYILMFKILDDVVVVYRIFYSGRDYEKLL